MPRPDMISLLQHSEFFYAYEDTFLIMEAVLCGCPVVLLPSETFKECHTLEDYGTNGVAWGNDPEKVKTAEATVAHGRAELFERDGRVLDGARPFHPRDASEVRRSSAKIRFQRADLSSRAFTSPTIVTACRWRPGRVAPRVDRW